MARPSFGPGWARRAIKASNKRIAAKRAQEAVKAQAPVNRNASRQLSSTAVWAIKNPDLAAYDNDGNPVDKSVWFD
jgi:hypothetical protein